MSAAQAEARLFLSLLPAGLPRSRSSENEDGEILLQPIRLN